MSALVADTGGLLRALAADSSGRPSWPAFTEALLRASTVIVPALVLAEIDCFLRRDRAAMRKLMAEILDPSTTYELEPVIPQDLVRALALDAKFASLELGLVDATVAAVAERRRVYRVLTTDRHDLGPVRVGPRHDRALEILPE